MLPGFDSLPLRKSYVALLKRVGAVIKTGGVINENLSINGNVSISGNVSAQSMNGGQLAGLRNLLINANFIVNQRGYVSGAATTGANQYTLDRWRVVTSGQNLPFSLSGNGNVVTAPAGGVEQVIEGSNIAGGVYTLSWVGTATATVNGSACGNGGNVTLTANANATVRFIGGTVSKAQLENGVVASAFEYRPYGLELEHCQRYCWRTAFSDNYIGWFYSSGNGFQWSVKFPTTMRVAPTHTIVGSGMAIGSQASNPTPGAVNALTLTVESAYLDTSATPGNAGNIAGKVQYGASQYSLFSAEL